MYKKMGCRPLSEWLFGLEDYILDGTPDLSGELPALRTDVRRAVERAHELECENDKLSNELSWRRGQVRALEERICYLER